MTAIDRDGVYDIPAAEYHAHRSLSSSTAKKLLPPSCPAQFFHEWEHGQAPKAEWDFGKAAHKRVLGVGDDVELIDADDYLTKKAKEAKAKAYAEGKVPILPRENAVIEAMVKALGEHPYASELFNPERGKPEQSLFWMDRDTDVKCRARLDWLPDIDQRGRLLVADYKTADKVDPLSIGKSLNDFGYAFQAAWYLDAIAAIGLAERAAFLLVVQAKTPPYLVTVAELDAESLRVGAYRIKQARQIFRECAVSGRWPGWSDDEPVTVSLPGYVLNRFYEETGL